MNPRRLFLILVPYLWLLALFLIPFVIVVKISLSDVVIAIPPYTPNLDLSAGWQGFQEFLSELDFENYEFIGAGALVATFAGIFLCIAICVWAFKRIFPRLKVHFENRVSATVLVSALLTILAAGVLCTAAMAVLWLVYSVVSSVFPSIGPFFEIADDLYWKAYLSSLWIAMMSTVITLLVGFPIAYGMAQAPDEWRPTLMMMVILPFWTSFLIRVYSWMGILSQEGFLNQFLMWTGIISEPLTILNTNIAVYIGIVYTYLPFMILPIYATLEKLDGSLIEAAEDLGCSRMQAFWLVTVPLSMSGVIAGCFLVFIPALGEFVIPSILGGSGTLMIGKVLWEEFFSNRDWPVASAVAVVLLLILIIPIVLFQRNEQRQREAGQ